MNRIKIHHIINKTCESNWPEAIIQMSSYRSYISSKNVVLVILHYGCYPSSVLQFIVDTIWATFIWCKFFWNSCSITVQHHGELKSPVVLYPQATVSSRETFHPSDQVTWHFVLAAILDVLLTGRQCICDALVNLMSSSWDEEQHVCQHLRSAKWQ